MRVCIEKSTIRSIDRKMYLFTDDTLGWGDLPRHYFDYRFTKQSFRTGPTIPRSLPWAILLRDPHQSKLKYGARRNAFWNRCFCWGIIFHNNNFKNLQANKVQLLYLKKVKLDCKNCLAAVSLKACVFVSLFSLGGTSLSPTQVHGLLHKLKIFQKSQTSKRAISEQFPNSKV